VSKIAHEFFLFLNITFDSISPKYKYDIIFERSLRVKNEKKIQTQIFGTKFKYDNQSSLIFFHIFKVEKNYEYEFRFFFNFCKLKQKNKNQEFNFHFLSGTN
jgi:hypothetical protein